jgi:hypothetical protein
MRVFNIIFTILFLVSAALQYNDPDPYLWIPIYLLGAYLCWSAYKGIHRRRLSIIAILIYTAYALFLFIDDNGVLSWARDHAAESLVQTMKADKPWIEETREFGGLVILIAVAVINLIAYRSKTSA